MKTSLKICFNIQKVNENIEKYITYYTVNNKLKNKTIFLYDKIISDENSKEH